VQKKVYEEMVEIFGGDMSRPITMDDLRRMEYLEMCIKESLRLYPSVPSILRTVTSDLQLGTVCMITF
jgi:cytochrome P450